MGRPRRVADGGLIYHVLNRGNARMTIFEKDADYDAFEGILEQVVERYGTDLLAWCLMPNHWHLVVKPHEDGESAGWLEHVNTPLTDAELPALRQSVVRGCLYGDDRWSQRMVKRLGLESTLRPRKRPKKEEQWFLISSNRHPLNHFLWVI